MKLTYYPDTDTLSISLCSGAISAESREIAHDVVVDYDEHRNVVVVDIDLASTKVDLDIVDAVGLPNVHVASTAPHAPEVAISGASGTP